MAVEVLMVDDHPIVATAVSTLLEADGYFNVTCVANGREALVAYNTNKPRVVLCDISLDADMSGIELTRRLVSQDPEAIVVMFTSHTDEEHITAALEAGASGYITKGTKPPALKGYLIEAAEGMPVYDQAVTRTVISILRRKDKAPEPTDLTPREREILVLLCSEIVNNKAIAEELVVSEQTVKTHLQRIYSKLGVTSKTQAAVRAFRLGLVTAKDLEQAPQ